MTLQHNHVTLAQAFSVFLLWYPQLFFLKLMTHCPKMTAVTPATSTLFSGKKQNRTKTVKKGGRMCWLETVKRSEHSQHNRVNKRVEVEKPNVCLEVSQETNFTYSHVFSSLFCPKLITQDVTGRKVFHGLTFGSPLQPSESNKNIMQATQVIINFVLSALKK